MIAQINIQKSERMDKTPVIKQKKINEFIYFALRNTKLKVGLSVVLFFLLLTIIGPLFTSYKWNAYIGPISQPPSAEYWLGTTTFGQDVYTQFVLGLRATFLVGIIGGGIGTLIGILVGFTGGYRGGMVDESLNIITNIILVIPTFAILLIIAAYLKVRGIMTESIFIGFTAWPWAARAIRAQTFSLRSRDFVDLARMSGMKPLKIIFTEIAPNMMSYLLMTFILQFGGAILIAATLDFIGLGPTNAISLGLMMNYAVLWGALQFGNWWWFVPPGFAIMAIVGSLYIMNVGLDEVFNPKLREM
jgi:peptide/nickel transport system permease protein